MVTLPAVHPRAGGEHARAPAFLECKIGSSPRRRGTRAVAAAAQAVQRFIPAQAGNTRQSGGAWFQHPVHPRAGGEHLSPMPAISSAVGSSPRRRGTRDRITVSLHMKRFIPAQAGNTPVQQHKEQKPSVHPRAGGEHSERSLIPYFQYGSSPRRRGTPNSIVNILSVSRFIPAQAGNTGGYVGRSRIDPVHPRAGGEHVVSVPRCSQAGGSSPRRRGTLSLSPVRCIVGRFIPAQAGNTINVVNSSLHAAVHPRAGGEHTLRISRSVDRFGSSPRRRGTRASIRLV